VGVSNSLDSEASSDATELTDKSQGKAQRGKKTASPDLDGTTLTVTVSSRDAHVTRSSI
jgi:hypothetical protein